MAALNMQRENMYVLAELMDGTMLTLRDKFVFSSAPVGSNNTYAQSALVYFAGKLVNDGEVFIHASDFPIPSVDQIKTAEKLSQVEEMYSIVDTYRWLSLRYADGFPSGTLANDLAVHLSDLIGAALDAPWLSPDEIRVQRSKRQARAREEVKAARRVVEQEQARRDADKQGRRAQRRAKRKKGKSNAR